VIRTLASTTVTALLGTTVVTCLYWGFLNTPESTVAALALSLLLALAAVTLAAATINLVLLAWTAESVSTALVRRAGRQVPAGLLPLLFLAAAWWVVLRVEGWLELRSGEISAWFIAQFGWADVSWLFRAAALIGLWLRWVVTPLAALVWWRRILGGTWQPSSAAIKEVVNPRRILEATVIVCLLVWVPWRHLVPWRPTALTPGTQELVFVGAKLALVALLGALASTLLVRTAAIARPASPRPGPTHV
jgi:hypothetical protein